MGSDESQFGESGGGEEVRSAFGSQTGPDLPGYQSYGSGSPYGGNQLQGGPNRSPFDWFLEVFRKYATFEGRAIRSEYWWFILFNFIVAVVLEILAAAVKDLIVLLWIYSLAVIVPSIAVTCRRLHDVGMSGWLQLIQIVPLIGWLVLLIFTVKDSQPMTNQYGPNPKGF